MTNILENDIEYAEKILLPEGNLFDEERRNIIRCLETKDIKACPGSGKTTALLAKLLILEKKLPLERNRGICVLTHTNVAINEIESRLETRHSRLFSYPNNFSTIQAFVDKYLASPAYLKFKRKEIHSIDNDTYREMFLREYRRVFRPGTDAALTNRGLTPEILSENLQYNLRDRTAITNEQRAFNFGIQTMTYRNLFNIKNNLFENGILSFHDAYVLAFEYIRKFPTIKDIISARFAYLFLDEMQDTDEKQGELLTRIFDEGKTIIQKIGDENQAIFDAGQGNLWEPREGYLSISDSKRFSIAIAEKVKNVCVNPQVLIGNPEIEPHAPVILKFKNEDIKKLLPAFATLIFSLELYNLDNNVFKAIGRVGKIRDDDKLTIGSYYDGYVKNHPKKKKSFTCIKGYLAALTVIDSQNVVQYRNLLVSCILKSLRVLEVKNDDRWFTDRTLLKTLKEIDQNLLASLNRNLAIWIKKHLSNQDFKQELKDFITLLARRFNGNVRSPDFQLFLYGEENIMPIDDEGNTTCNLYTFEQNGTEVQIHLDTIHNVKGETHTATLYLETYNYHYDFEKVIEYLKGNRLRNPGVRLSENLRLAYVGMTRPSHLLCLAIREESINGHEEILEDLGWRVLDVNRV